MDNSRLIINQIEIKDYDPSEFSVIITWASKLISELNSFSTFRTKTNTLPVTRDVNRALKSPLLIDSDSAMRTTTKSTIDFYIGSDVVLRGYIRIMKGNIDEIGGSIEFVVTSRERDWIDGLKAITMQDLDLSAHDHLITEQNIWDSNADQATWASDPQYIPVDVGRIGWRSIIGMRQGLPSPLGVVLTQVFYTGEDIGNAVTESVTLEDCPDDTVNIDCDLLGVNIAYWNTLGVYEATTYDLPLVNDSHLQAGFFARNAELEWRVHDMIPAMPIDILINEAFKAVGYTIENSWVDDTLADFYHYEYNTKVWAKGFDASLRFSVGIVVEDYLLTGVKGSTEVPFYTMIGTGLLNNSNYDATNSNILANVVAHTHESKWVAPYACFMALKTHIKFHALATNIQFTVRDNVGVVVATLDVTSLTGDDHDVTLAAVAYLGVGHWVTVDILFDTNPSGYDPLVLKDAYFEGKQILKIIPSMTAHMSDFQTDKSAYDFIKAWAFKYNLQFFTDPDLKMVTIVPDQSKMLRKVADWRDRLQGGNTSTVVPISTLHPLKYRLDYLSDANDFEMLRREAISGRFAGGDIDNDDPFAKETTEYISPVYAATVNGQSAFYDFVARGFPVMKGENDARLDYVSRVLEVDYESENETQEVEGTPTIPTWSFEGNVVVYLNHGSFPSALEFENLITNQYERFVNMLRFGYIFKGVFLLNATDAGKLNHVDDNVGAFRTRYQIKVKGVEIEAELLRVIDYQPNGDGYTLVEMICQKVNN